MQEQHTIDQISTENTESEHKPNMPAIILPEAFINNNITLVQFLRDKYGDFPGWLPLFSMQNPGKTSFYTASDIDALAEEIVSRMDNEDLYVGVGTLRQLPEKGKRGKAEHIGFLPGFVMDIDVAEFKESDQPYCATKDEARNFLSSFPLQPTTLIDTSGGYHAHWSIAEGLHINTPEAYIYADALSEAFQQTGIAHFNAQRRTIDNVGDLARVCRIPGTFNHKNDPKKLVQIVHHNPALRYTLAEIEAVVKDHLNKATVKRAHRNEPGSFPLADHDLIRAGCAWYAYYTGDGAATSNEPNWHGTISVTACCKNGEEISHDYSKKYPNYDEKKTSQKFQRAVEERKPWRCETIQGHGNDRFCGQCSHFGRISSPVVLGTESLAAPDATTTIAQKLVKVMEDAGVELIHDSSKKTYMRVRAATGKGKLTFLLSTTMAEMYMMQEFYKAYKKPVPANSMKEAKGALAAKALFEGPCLPVSMRMGRHAGDNYIDLGDETGRAIHITAKGWQVTDDVPIAFVRYPGMESLPEPQTGGDLNEFKKLMGLSDAHFHLVLVFLLVCYKASGHYFLMILEGLQGSGKSVLSTFLKLLVDPRLPPKLRLPDTERDLMIQAQQNHLLIFDNVSGMRNDLSDAFCALATGTGFATRKLYTDDEMQVFMLSRPVLFNGIGDFAQRPDLLERAIPLKLPSMPEGSRRTEDELDAAFEEMRPRLLGCIFDAVSCALRRFNEVKAPKEFRMQDGAKWVLAAEPAIGVPEGSLLAALAREQEELILQRMETNTLATMLLTHCKNNPFKGTMTELFAQLRIADHPERRRLPSDSSKLSAALNRLQPALQKIGLHIERGTRTRGKRPLRIWYQAVPEFEPDVPEPSLMSQGPLKF